MNISEAEKLLLSNSLFSNLFLIYMNLLFIWEKFVKEDQQTFNEISEIV